MAMTRGGDTVLVKFFGASSQTPCSFTPDARGFQKIHVSYMYLIQYRCISCELACIGHGIAESDTSRDTSEGAERKKG